MIRNFTKARAREKKTRIALNFVFLSKRKEARRQKKGMMEVEKKRQGCVEKIGLNKRGEKKKRQSFSSEKKR